MDRIRWPWWLAAALVGVSMAMWWRPSVEDAAVPAPAAAPAMLPAMPAPEPSRAVAAPPAAAHAPAFRLVGTAVGGASSFATVRRTTDSQLLQLRVGDRIDGLTVSAIEPDRIVLAGAAAPPVVIEIEATAAAPLPHVLPRAAGPAAASQPEQPAYADGEAPWDAGANFRH